MSNQYCARTFDKLALTSATFNTCPKYLASHRLAHQVARPIPGASRQHPTCKVARDLRRSALWDQGFWW